MYLWKNERTVVIGYNQNPYAECNVQLLLDEGGHLMRRGTGGGAVYHDLGNINFSFIADKSLYDVKKQLSVIQDALLSYGLQTEISGRNDLICEVPVPFGVAALGGKLDVPTISGKATIVIPKGSQFGRVLRLAGKGAPSARRGGSRGDLHVRLVIETPVNLNKEQQALLEKFTASLDKSNTPVQNAFVENAGSFLADKE